MFRVVHTPIISTGLTVSTVIGTIIGQAQVVSGTASQCSLYIYIYIYIYIFQFFLKAKVKNAISQGPNTEGICTYYFSPRGLEAAQKFISEDGRQRTHKQQPTQPHTAVQ